MPVITITFRHVDTLSRELLGHALVLLCTWNGIKLSFLDEDKVFPVLYERHGHNFDRKKCQNNDFFFFFFCLQTWKINCRMVA